MVLITSSFPADHSQRHQLGSVFTIESIRQFCTASFILYTVYNVNNIIEQTAFDLYRNIEHKT